MRITVTNSTCKVEGELPPGCLAFFEHEYKTVRKLKGQKHPEWVTHRLSLFNSYARTFPTGLLYKFKDYLFTNYDTIPEITLTRRTANQKVKLPAAWNVSLRSHQTKAVSEAIKRSRGLIVSPTGSGKTFIAAKIIEELHCNTLYLVNNLDLLEQTAEVLVGLFSQKNVGMIGKSIFNPSKITVSTVQTLWARFQSTDVKSFLQSIDLLIGDEIHHISYNIDRSKGEKYPGNSFFEVIQAVDSFYKFGFSARINREGSLRRKFLEATIGRPFFHITYNELREQGYLANVCVFIVVTPHIQKQVNYQVAYREGIQKNDWVHNLITDTALHLKKQGKTSVIMVTRLNKTDVVSYRKDAYGNDVPVYGKTMGHAGLIYETLEQKDRGSAVLLTGESASEDRLRLRGLLNKKELKIAVGTVLREGVDIPTLDAVLYVCGGRAETDDNDDVDSSACIQAIGRALRNLGGLADQKRAVHVDLIYSDKGMLQKHSMERIQAYKEHGYNVVMVSPDTLNVAIDAWTKEGVIVGSLL